MAKEGSYSISIVAIDKTTAVIDKINAKLVSMQKAAAKPFQEMAAPLKQLGKSLSELVSNSVIGKIARGFSFVFGKMKGIARYAMKALGPLGAIFAAGITSLIWKSTQAWASYGHQVKTTSALLGLSNEQSQRLRQTGRVMGMGPEELPDMAAGLQSMKHEAVINPSGFEANILKQAGINPQGKTRFQTTDYKPEELEAVSKDIKHRRDVDHADWSSIEKRWAPAGITLPQILQLYVGNLKEAEAIAKKSNALDDKQVEQAEKENKLMGQFNNNLEQLTIGIGSMATVAVNPIINSFNKLMEPTDKLTGLFSTLSDTLTKMAGLTPGASGPTIGGVEPGEGGSLLDLLLLGPRAWPLALTGPWGGQDPQFSKEKNDQYRREHPQQPRGALGRWWDRVTAWPSSGDNEGTPRGGIPLSQGGNANANAILAGMGGNGANVKDGTFTQMAPQIMGELMKDYSLTPEQAAGMVGNLGHESAGFTAMQEVNPVGGGRGGAGWAMWTGTRRQDFEKYCKDNNLDPKSPEANYGFLKQELNTSESGAVDAVKRQTSTEGSTQAFEGGFERAGVKAYESRYRYARMALDAYQKNKTATAAAPTGRAKIDVNLNGFPKGTSIAASSYGDLLGTPNVAMGMQGAFG